MKDRPTCNSLHITFVAFSRGDNSNQLFYQLPVWHVHLKRFFFTLGVISVSSARTDCTSSCSSILKVEFHWTAQSFWSFLGLMCNWDCFTFRAQVATDEWPTTRLAAAITFVISDRIKPVLLPTIECVQYILCVMGSARTAPMANSWLRRYRAPYTTSLCLLLQPMV